MRASRETSRGTTSASSYSAASTVYRGQAVGAGVGTAGAALSATSTIRQAATSRKPTPTATTITAPVRSGCSQTLTPPQLARAVRLSHWKGARPLRPALSSGTGP